MSAVTEYSHTIRGIGHELTVPVADSFDAYENIRHRNPTEWMLLMSEDIHPSMEGHKLQAETVAEAISGKPVSLADVPPLADTLRFSLARLEAAQPINVIAMPPYDSIVADVLTELFPGAKLNVTTWPVEGQSLAAMVEWAKGIRNRKPHLVVTAVPAGVAAGNEESFIRDYHSIVSWSVAFSHAEWDLLPILPSVAGPVAKDELHRSELARRIVAGADVEYLDRSCGDVRPAHQIVFEWFGHRRARY